VKSRGNNFNYFFSKNKPAKLANLVQFQRMLMSCLADWSGLGSLVSPSLSTPLMEMLIRISIRI